MVVVGGGAGGLELVTRQGRRLGRRGLAEVTLIDSGRTHIWKLLLHQVAAGSFDPCLHSVDYLAQERRNHFRFRMGTRESLDHAQRRVWLSAA